MKKMFPFFLIISIMSFAKPLITPETTWEELAEQGILESDGKNFNVYHPKDVISYTRHLFEPSYLEGLKKKYQGLDNNEKLTRLLKKQEYIEILNHLWTERNYTIRINWLQEAVSDNHPMMMMELAHAYFLRSPTLETYQIKSLPLLRVAKMRLEMDASCTSDESVFSGVSVVENYEMIILETLLQRNNNDEIQEYLLKNLEGEFISLYKLAKILLYPFTQKETHNLPSPSWIFYQGLGSFLDVPNEVLAEDWDQIRKEIACERLNIIAEHEDAYENNYSEWLAYIQQFAPKKE